MKGTRLTPTERTQKRRAGIKRGEWYLCYLLYQINFNSTFNYVPGFKSVYDRILSVVPKRIQSIMDARACRERKNIKMRQRRFRAKRTFMALFLIEAISGNDSCLSEYETFFDSARIIILFKIYNIITHAKHVVDKVSPQAGNFFGNSFFLEKRHKAMDERTLIASYHKRVYIAAKQFVTMYMKGNPVRSPYGLEIKMRRVFLMDMDKLRQQEEIQSRMFEMIRFKEDRDRCAQESVKIAMEFDKLVDSIADGIEDEELSSVERFRIAREIADKQAHPEKYSAPESGWGDYDSKRLYESLPVELREVVFNKAEKIYLDANSWAKQRFYLSPPEKKLGLMRYELSLILNEMNLVEEYRVKINMKAPEKLVSV